VEFATFLTLLAEIDRVRVVLIEGIAKTNARPGWRLRSPRASSTSSH
jgi:hypothetical protein